ncbi:MAG: prepilin-type N-terminal cleavage/methylation domain-containing protein [Chthoniobacteraceae bacterium]
MKRAGFTLTEMIVSLAASVILIAGLLLGAVGLQRTLHDNETFATSYADQRRVIDVVSRDLRRAIGLSIIDSGGVSSPFTSGLVAVGDGTALVFALPAYYQSNVPTDPTYDKPLVAVTTGERLSYGDVGGVKPEVPVQFSKEFVAAANCVCFVRKEADHSAIVVRDAAELFLKVTMAADGRSCVVEAWFRSQARGVKPVISTYDRVMLRNIRTD